MKKTLFTLFLLNLFMGLSLKAQSDSTGTLEIEFTGIKSDKGQIAIGINYLPERFPREPDVEIQYEKDGLKDGRISIQIEDLAFGTYAISAMDDLDRNLKMKMFMGIPKEAHGFSGNPTFKLRAPRFEECAFEFNQSLMKITIHM